MYRRDGEAAERQKRRIEREDAAPRLVDEVPDLRELRLTIRYLRGETRVGDANHTKVVVVSRAPALFVIPCHDKACRDGGHDVTSLVMDGLRRRREHFEGSDTCHGVLGSAEGRCTGTMTFEAEAVYER